MALNSTALSFIKSGIQKGTSVPLSKAKFTLAASAIPVIITPTGTMAGTGIITLGTNLPFAYGYAWVKLPASAVVGGAAGLYFANVTGVSSVQVYTNYQDPAAAFVPYIPTGTLVAAVGTVGAVTGGTAAADAVLVNVAVPAGSLGVNGSITTKVLASFNATAGAKNVSAKLGASKFLSADTGVTTTTMDVTKKVSNRGVANVQIAHANWITGAVATVAPTQLTINTAAATTVTITGNITTGTDFLVLESFEVETLTAE